MFKNLWNRIRNLFSAINNNTSEYVFRELVINEYKSVKYCVYRAKSLEELLVAKERIRNFQRLLISNRLEYWGRVYVKELIALWNAKFRYWKNKTRNK